VCKRGVDHHIHVIIHCVYLNFLHFFHKLSFYTTLTTRVLSSSIYLS
jgi:hypothetical protein